MNRIVLFALPFALAATPGLSQTADALQVVRSERAFAADVAATGIGGGFNKWSVPDAIIIGGGRVQTIREAYPPGAPRPADEPSLEWWPNFAGIARSDDFGFSTGGVALGGRRAGHYLTVWRRQPDGSWKWIYDGGSQSSAADVPGPDSEPALLAVAEGGSGSAEAAMSEVTAAEAAFARLAATDQKAAYLDAMADDGRLYVGQRPPAIGRETFAEALDEWPAAFEFGPTQGGSASNAGDMAWTYGPAVWSRDGQARQGHYVRVWQKRADGWKMVLAQLLPAPAPRPAPSPPPAGG